MEIISGYDPTTLREVVNLPALDARLAEMGDGRSRAVLNEKVGLLRMAGRLGEALDVANAAVREARFGGDREELLLARLRHAQVQQALGKLDAALIELSGCVLEARSHEWPSSEAFALQHRGKVRFEQGDLAGALRDFRTALTIRVRVKAPEEQIDSSLFSIEATEKHLAGEL